MEEKMKMAEYWKHFSVSNMENTLPLCTKSPAELLKNLNGMKEYLIHLLKERKEKLFLAEAEKACAISEELIESIESDFHIEKDQSVQEKLRMSQIVLEEFVEGMEVSIKEVKKAEEETKKEKMIGVQLQLGGLA